MKTVAELEKEVAELKARISLQDKMIERLLDAPPVQAAPAPAPVCMLQHFPWATPCNLPHYPAVCTRPHVGDPYLQPNQWWPWMNPNPIVYGTTVGTTIAAGAAGCAPQYFDSIVIGAVNPSQDSILSYTIAPINNNAACANQWLGNWTTFDIGGGRTQS